MHTTGEVIGTVREQALSLETAKGWVVITGCAHPGVDTLVRAAREVTSGDVYLVLGGFHLGSASTPQVRRIISDLREMGVEKVAPSHCTGEKAMAEFAAGYGDDFVRCGVGFRWSVEDWLEAKPSG